MLVLTLGTRLDTLRQLGSSDVLELASNIFEPELLPLTYLEGLNEARHVDAMRASLACWFITEGKQIPREMQLRTVIADLLGQDALISAGTGSGKTLPIAINITLDDPEKHGISIVISPLKRLQSTQVTDFVSRYGIDAVSINEDTPTDLDWWANHVHNLKKNVPGTARLLIVTVEQFFKTAAGHYTRLGHLIRSNRFFRLRITRIAIDEAHFIATAGIPHYELAAFRPSWGKLKELKEILPGSVKWAAFSATFPPYVLETVKSHVLNAEHEIIRFTSNRPNTRYATHLVPVSLDDPRIYECFLSSPFNRATQPRVIIFVDNRNHVKRIASHLQQCVGEKNKDAVGFYHGDMSAEFLDGSYTSFNNHDGKCLVLVATSGASTGVDFSQVNIVVNAGLTDTLIDLLQRAGRAMRILDKPALFVVFYESWALDISEDEYTYGDPSDPDRPRSSVMSDPGR